MPDWTKSMQQTFEYFVVDPGTWLDKEKVDNVESCTITRDSEDETLGSAALRCLTDQSDNYIRTYLVTIQNGVRERFALGTHIYQTPSSSYDGKTKTSDQDGYTPLLELKEKLPPLGYAILKGVNIMAIASSVVKENARAPVVPVTASDNSDSLIENFVSNTNDTWLTFTSDLISNAKYVFDVDELGRIQFSKKQDPAALQPVWVYNDDNSSILYPELTMERDLYGVPNVVEVVYSPTNGIPITVRVSNDDPNSVVSTKSRGREVVYRETNPDVVEGLDRESLKSYATDLLKTKSSLEYSITYKHGYCPVRVGDCIMLNYKRADLKYIKAKVTRQVISCTGGCSVEETAVFTKNLWEG